MKEIDGWQLSPRIWIEAGSLIRLSGGPVTSTGAVMSLPGKFLVLRVYGRGQRVWLEIRGIDKTSGTFIAFVQGRAYERFCVTWKPYKVRRAK
jgi:hypothetical protein